jgi:hypothetical protein
MSALTKTRIVSAPTGVIPAMSFPLPIGQVAIEGGIACFDTANLGGVYRGATGSTTLVPIGWFTESVDNSAGSAAVPVGVKLNREIHLSYWDSVTGANAVTSSKIGGLAYMADDQTLTTSNTTASSAGRVYLVRADGQVGVEFPF